MFNLKKLLSYVLIGTIVCLFASPNSASALGRKSEAISLEKAIDMATTESAEIGLFNEKIKNAENRLSYAVRNAEVKKTDNWSTDEGRAELKKEIELVPVQKRNIVQVLKLQKIEKINTLKMDVTKEYFTYLMIQEQLENQVKELERLNKKLEVVKAQVSNGMVNKVALSDIEVAIKTAEQQKAVLNRDLSNTGINLNSLLGRPIMSSLELTKQELVLPDLKISIEELINKKIANSSQILQTLNNETEAKIEYNITDFSSTKAVPDGIEEAQNRILNASYDYKKLLQDMKCKVLNDYNDLLNLHDDIDIKKLQCDIAEKELAKANVEYQRGLIDVIKYNSAVETFENAQIAYKKAQLDYYIASEVFKN